MGGMVHGFQEGDVGVVGLGYLTLVAWVLWRAVTLLGR